MKEKPILFSTPMVRAILDGRKTVTRRVIKPQPSLLRDNTKYRCDGFSDEIDGDGRYYVERLDDNGEPSEDYISIEPPPRYIYGDILWVRETWSPFRPEHIIDGKQYAYKADELSGDSRAARIAYGYKWKPSIFMPREACRIRLRVTDVRIERLQEIPGEDIAKEGFINPIFPKAKYEFMVLWDKLNEKRGYGVNSNPYVYVYEFERIKEGMS